MNFDTVITALVALLSLFLGFLVLFSDRKSISNWLFFAFNFFASLWIFSSLAAKYSTIDTVKPFVSIGFAAASLLVYFFLMFCITFPNNDKRFNKLWHILLIPPLAFAVFSFFDLVAIAVPSDINSFKVSNALLYIPYSLFLLIYIIASISRLIINYRNEKGITKSQIYYILMGSSLYAFLALLFSLVMPVITHNPNIYEWGIYSVIIFLIFTAYAIVERGFLKTRVILTDAVVTGVIFILLVQVLLSDTIKRGLVNATILFIVSYGGLLIIKSVKKEIEQNKQLQLFAKKLERDKKQLIKVDRMKDEFLMMATHELTTPITAIRGKLAMAVEENMAHLDDEQKKYFTPALDATNRLNHLSQQLLNVTRIEQKELVINPEPISIDDLIKDVLVQYQGEANIKNNKLIYNPKYKGKQISIDSKKIKEVVSNLIDNSLNFTKDGKITIETKMDESGQNLIVSIADTGAGIDEESKKDLFGKFNQSNRFDPNSLQEQQGAGLGLYISKKFIELHGGKIWFESEKDKGSTFYFSLPIKTEEAKTKVDADFDTSKFTL